MPGNRAGLFNSQGPQGIILHATRSGRDWPAEEERRDFDATVNYVRAGAGADRLGWNITAGPGLIAEHLAPHEWGWNAGAPASRTYLAIEFAQARLGDQISDSTLDAAAWWVRERVLRHWPNMPLMLVHHASLAQGKAQGKTDVYPDSDPRQAEFTERFAARLR